MVPGRASSTSGCISALGPTTTCRTLHCQFPGILYTDHYKLQGCCAQLLPRSWYVRAKQTGMPYDHSQVCKLAFDCTHMKACLLQGVQGSMLAERLAWLVTFTGMLVANDTQVAVAKGTAHLCKVLSQVWQDHVLLLPDQILEHAYLHAASTNFCTKFRLKDTHLKPMHQLGAVPA